MIDRPTLAGAVPPRSLMAEFAARVDMLMFLISHVENHCVQAGLSDEVSQRAGLILEELFVNALKHGGAGNAEDACVQVELELARDELRVYFEDGGTAFDPFADLREPTLDQVGGRGRWLVATLSRRREYRRRDERNCVTVWLAAC